MKAEIVSQICGISKNHILNLRKETIWENFSKRSRKSIKLDYFDQEAFFLLNFRFYRKPAPKMFKFDKILSNCKDIPGFLYPSKSTLRKWRVKITFFDKHQRKILHVCWKCYEISRKRKYFKIVKSLKS